MSLIFSIAGSPVKAANFPISVPLTSRLHFSNGTNNFLEHRDFSMRRQSSVNVPLISTYANYVHVLAVDVGNPPTTYKLILDSGSANTWVRASKYVKTGSSFPTGEPVKITYGSGTVSGTEWFDCVTIGPGLTIIQQSIGVADEIKGFSIYDGLIGIGPAALTVGTLGDLQTEPIPTVTDSLFIQGTISENVLGIFFEPYVSPPLETNGQITFGGTDPTKYNGNIEYAPPVNIGRSRKFWGVNLSITYGNSVILRSTTGIVDSGTTLITLATDAYQQYQLATGAEYDHATKLLTIPEDKYGALHNLDFHIGDKTYSLTPNAQIWPRSLSTKIKGGKEGSIYLIFRDRGTYSGQDEFSDFSLGQAFMQRFYVAYDFTNSRVGFATTEFTDATTN